MSNKNETNIKRGQWKIHIKYCTELNTDLYIDYKDFTADEQEHCEKLIEDRKVEELADFLYIEKNIDLDKQVIKASKKRMKEIDFISQCVPQYSSMIYTTGIEV